MNTSVVNCKPPFSSTGVTRVMLLLVDGVSLTTVSSTLEPFQQANACQNGNCFDIQLVSLTGKDPTTRAGIQIPCQFSSEHVLTPNQLSERPDLVILCCGLTLDSSSQELLQRFIRKLFHSGVTFFALGAACEAIAIAKAIKGRKCAAHWKSRASLGERFPNFDFDNVLYAADGNVTSCAGELASFDLILDFIERVCGPRISGEVCNHFLASPKRSGETQQLLNADALICEDARFQQALDIMTENIEAPISTTEIARRIGISSRQVERIFSRNGFEPPKKYYIRLRLNQARQFLDQTKMPLSEIALACGFENQTTFSKNYRRVFGQSPGGHRSKKTLAYCAAN